MNQFHNNLNHILKRFLQLLILYLSFRIFAFIVFRIFTFPKGSFIWIQLSYIAVPLLLFYSIIIRDRIRARRYKDDDE